jgi:hypothetical protein
MIRHGKKVGTLEVQLDRKETRYKHASVDVELRFDLYYGTFWAEFEGNWFSADTKDGLAAQIKTVATKALSLEWKRYILIDYAAKGWPLADEKIGRPEIQGRYHTYELGEDRSKFEDKAEKYVICGIELHWNICEISEPYTLPEDPKKKVRAKRTISVHAWGDDMGKEQISEPDEWEDDVLPPGTLLWTPEREALLVEIIAAFGKLDRRLLDLLSGDAAQLAAQIDAAAQTDASRLLTAPAETTPSPSQKKRRRA